MKTSELRIGFCKPKAMLDPIIVKEDLEVVDNAKIGLGIGLGVSSVLNLNDDIEQTPSF